MLDRRFGHILLGFVLGSLLTFWFSLSSRVEAQQTSGAECATVSGSPSSAAAEMNGLIAKGKKDFISVGNIVCGW